MYNQIKKGGRCFGIKPNSIFSTTVMWQIVKYIHSKHSLQKDWVFICPMAENFVAVCDMLLKFHKLSAKFVCNFIVEIWSSTDSEVLDPPTQKFWDMISHRIYIDLRNNINGLQKREFSSKGGKLSCLCAMPLGKNVQSCRQFFHYY